MCVKRKLIGTHGWAIKWTCPWPPPKPGELRRLRFTLQPLEIDYNVNRADWTQYVRSSSGLIPLCYGFISNNKICFNKYIVYYFHVLPIAMLNYHCHSTKRQLLELYLSSYPGWTDGRAETQSLTMCQSAANRNSWVGYQWAPPQPHVPYSNRGVRDKWPQIEHIMWGRPNLQGPYLQN